MEHCYSSWPPKQQRSHVSEAVSDSQSAQSCQNVIAVGSQGFTNRGLQRCTELGPSKRKELSSSGLPKGLWAPKGALGMLLSCLLRLRPGLFPLRESCSARRGACAVLYSSCSVPAGTGLCPVPSSPSSNFWCLSE